MHIDPQNGRRLRDAILASVCLVLAACAPNYDAFQIDRQLSKTLGAAQFHLGLREYAEAAQLARAIEEIDPEYPGLAEVQAGLRSETDYLFRTTLIGSNRARRKPVERSFGQRALRYLPDRLLDLFDVVSVDAHSGFGAFGDVHLTRAAHGVLGARVAGGLGSYPQRNGVGFQLQADAGASFMGIGRHSFTGFVAGPGGVYTGLGELKGVHRPTDRFYQDFRDYWAIGGSATVGIFGGGAEIHPVQALDFLLGFAMIDIGNDDSSHTVPLRMLTSERDLLQDLARIRSSEELLARYRSNRDKLQSLSGPSF